MDTTESALAKIRAKQEFGSSIRQAREAKGISLRKMAKMLGVSATYLSYIEVGQTAPTPQRIAAIAAILETGQDELLARAGMIAPDVVEIILSDPRMWAETIRTIARQRARLDRQLAGRVKPIEPDDVDCGVPHLVEDDAPPHPSQLMGALTDRPCPHSGPLVPGKSQRLPKKS